MHQRGLDRLLAALGTPDAHGPELGNLRACVRSLAGQQPVPFDLDEALATVRPWPTRQRKSVFGALLFLEELTAPRAPAAR